ncbi:MULTISPECIES: putative porin [unclassified Pseudomonas]|uniref:putative porin n=1 Tax=unclassified Pseudomonas TaxID=196821 RepID=UPI0020976355|nr:MULTISPECIES: putative porin [unclassified Pseudomonas]MCO7521959.1 putative porin [Pseudomonas sp. 1]MCO7541426.1 putative porin [Pseudomonas sp. VA159-2]
MRLVSTLTGVSLTGMMLALSTPASAAVDAKLLEMLRANGSINQAQYNELQGDLAKETKEKADQKAQSERLSSFEQKVAWAAKTQIKGDVRLRYEDVNVDNPNSRSGNQDRERVRARVGFYSEINPQVDAGIRVATGSSSDARSTNQSLDNYFDKKSLWVDLAYLDWHPTAVPNLHLIGGKMMQPWVSMGDVIWDSDINPEGVAVTYKTNLGAAELFGSAGHYTLKDNVDGDGVQFKHDAQLYHGQLGTKFNAADTVKVTVGGSIYGFDNDKKSAVLRSFGNTTDEFNLVEGFGQVDFTGFAIPLSAYGQFVKNTESTDGEDKAWLAGLKTKVGAWNLDYNYRDVQRNAVVSLFTDSDFGAGFTGSRGHKFKVGYEIDKNFSLGAAYLMAKTDLSQLPNSNADVDTLQVDLEAKF